MREIEAFSRNHLSSSSSGQLILPFLRHRSGRSEAIFHHPQDNSLKILMPAYLFTDTVNKETSSAPSPDVIAQLVDVPVL
ncbi:hypothetical protein NPIL_170071 [Nephila pilipes]|uniref:Uncharacterized protein n=1 Tax=Nephila pilipes TaxID=299642 RepID=A0A8X6JAU6_NEPPI|nr:hypothetical protein NPIL_170071 [Nephila pilipes]